MGGDKSAAALASLAAFIAAEEFRPGELIGTERALAEMLDTSRSSLRSALESLERQDAVRRTIGRNGGVFAHDGRIQRHLNTIQGVPDMVRQQGMTVRTTVLSAELGPSRPAERRNLALEADDPVARITRLRSVGGRSWSLDVSVLPERFFPGVLSYDLTGSLYEVMTGGYVTTLAVAEETVETVGASEAQAQALGVPPGSALLRIWRTTIDADGRRVEFAVDHFRADRTRVHTQKVGVNWKRAVRREAVEARPL